MTKKNFMSGYKTYNTSDGFGNSNEWKNVFNKRMGFKEAQKIFEEENKTPHQILEMIDPSWSFYTFEALREQFKKMIIKHHPDQGGNTAMAQKIIAAYTILKRKFGIK